MIHHSDQGTQYTSIAICESFFATPKCELLDRRRFESQAEATMAIFEFIEGWYNSHRRHSSIGYLSPVNYERRIYPTRTQPLQCQAPTNKPTIYITSFKPLPS